MTVAVRNDLGALLVGLQMSSYASKHRFIGHWWHDHHLVLRPSIVGHRSLKENVGPNGEMGIGVKTAQHRALLSGLTCN
jgi:hypothetical protein